MRTWRYLPKEYGGQPRILTPDGAWDPSITPEAWATAAAYLTAFFGLLTLVALGDLPIDPATPWSRLVSRVDHGNGCARLGPSVQQRRAVTPAA